MGSRSLPNARADPRPGVLHRMRARIAQFAGPTGPSGYGQCCWSGNNEGQVLNYQVTTRNAHLHSLPLLHGHYLKGAGIAKLLEEDVVSLSPAMRAVERGGRFGHAMRPAEGVLRKDSRLLPPPFSPISSIAGTDVEKMGSGLTFSHRHSASDPCRQVMPDVMYTAWVWASLAVRDGVC